jgi:hypothetical protein
MDFAAFFILENKGIVVAVLLHGIDQVIADPIVPRGIFQYG